MDKAVALTIKVTSDARAAAAGIDGATQKVSKLGRAGQVAGRILAAGLLVAAGAAIKFTNAAADDAQAQQKLATTAQKVAGATKAQTASLEDWISAQGKSKGVTDDELRPALEKLLTVTKNVGQARRLASLAEDISARSGKSLESVTQALAKAQTGSVAGLAKYQVQTKDADGKTRSLAAVQKDLAKAYKGAAADGADTAAGKAKILSVQMGELQEQIGAQLLPVMAKLTSAGLKVVDWISKNQKAAIAIVGTLGALLAIIKAVSLAQSAFGAITAIVSVAQGVFAAVTGAGTVALEGNTAALAAHAAASKVSAAAQWLLNAAMSANPIVLIVIAVIALAAALVIAYKKSETFRDIVNAAFAGIAAAAGAVVDFIRNHWKAMLVILAGPIGLAVALIATHWDKIKAGGQAVVNWVQAHWPAIKATLVAAFSEAKERISAIIDAVKTVISAVKSTVETVASGVKGAIQGIIDKFQAAIDKVQALIDKINSIPNGNASGRSQQLGPRDTGGGHEATTERLLGRGSTHVHLHIAQGFVGDERALARALRDVLGADLRRLALT